MTRHILTTLVIVAVVVIITTFTISDSIFARKVVMERDYVTRAELAEIVSTLATKEDVKSAVKAEGEKTRTFIGELFKKHIELHH